MSLEERNGKLYYYRSVRHGDTVRRVYVGSGELARIAHEGDVAEREAERAAEENARREAELERTRLEALARIRKLQANTPGVQYNTQINVLRD